MADHSRVSVDDGTTFPSRIDPLNANVPGIYEWVKQEEQWDDGSRPYIDEHGNWVVPALRLVERSYYRLVPSQNSQSAGSTRGRPHKRQSLPTDLKDKVANIVNNPNTDCAKFLKILLGNANEKAFSDDPIKLIERVEGEKGFRLGNTGKYWGLAAMTGGKREIILRPVNATNDPRLAEHQAYAYAMRALNELMHHAKLSGRYDDRDLARAIAKSITPDELAAHPLPRTSDVETNSEYFHSLFNLHCRSLTGE